MLPVSGSAWSAGEELEEAAPGPAGCMSCSCDVSLDLGGARGPESFPCRGGTGAQDVACCSFIPSSTPETTRGTGSVPGTGDGGGGWS